MTSPDAIRAGIIAALAPLEGTFKLSKYVPSGPGLGPAIFCYPKSIDYDASMGRGSDEWTWCVEALVAQNIDEPSQKKLESLIGANGIKDLLQADRTLGGVVESLRVTNYEGFYLVETAQGAFLAAQWTVYMIASGR